MPEHKYHQNRLETWIGKKLSKHSSKAHMHHEWRFPYGKLTYLYQLHVHQELVVGLHAQKVHDSTNAHENHEYGCGSVLSAQILEIQKEGKTACTALQ